LDISGYLEMSTAEIKFKFPFSGISSFVSSLLQEMKSKRNINILIILFIFKLLATGYL
jgi:hypothetical protein